VSEGHGALLKMHVRNTNKGHHWVFIARENSRNLEITCKFSQEFPKMAKSAV
jgi:hypothetical protein